MILGNSRQNVVEYQKHENIPRRLHEIAYSYSKFQLGYPYACQSDEALLLRIEIFRDAATRDDICETKYGWKS
jgi:hypothetical protein